MASRLLRTGPRLAWLTGLLCVLAFGGLVRAAPPSADSGCTEVIPPEVTKIDGLTDHAHIKPGDVLCLPPGTRENLQIKNLNGLPGSPITLRNTEGKVVITGTLYANGGIGLRNSSYVRITGTGVSDKCGAEYAPEAQECGIEISFANKGVRLVTQAGEQFDHIEIDHVFVHDPTNPIAPTDARGILVHPVPGQTIVGFYVHHNYILRTTGEGIYIGTEPHGEPLDTLGKLQDVEASYNLVEQIGYDGIKIKVAVSNVRVHHNVIRNTALSQTPQHDAGLQIALSVGEYYNNYIETELEGIAMGRILESPGTKYYNNVVVGANVCLTAPEAGVQIFNNTVVGCKTIGIEAPGAGARVFDNIIADTAGIPIEAASADILAGNLVAFSPFVGFVDPAKRDYRLLPFSPAIDLGGSTGTFPTFDYDGNPRPFGPRSDAGAFECQCESTLQKTFAPLVGR